MSVLVLSVGEIEYAIEGPRGESAPVLARARQRMAVLVGCDTPGCRARYTVRIRRCETYTNARKRALREALAGAWRHVGALLLCGRCAAAHGQVSP